MKKILFISLFLLFVSCGLFKKVVKKEKEIKTEKTEQLEEKKSELSEKAERETLVLENENQLETTNIQADQITYNTNSGEFRASGDVRLVSTKKADKQIEKQEVVSQELRVKNEELKHEKQENNSNRSVNNQEKTKFGLGFWRWILLLFILILGYFVYRKLRYK